MVKDCYDSLLQGHALLKKLAGANLIHIIIIWTFILEESFFALSFRQGHPIVEQQNLESGCVGSLVIFLGCELFLCCISWEVVHAEA